MTFSAAMADDAVDFFRAVNVDNDRSVRILLEQGFDPNTRDAKGQTALHLALRDDSPRVVAALLANPKTAIDAVNASGETPAMMAALRGQVDTLRQLLDRGAVVNRPGWSPLHYAASGPEPQAVALLLDRGAAIDAPSPNRSTPLMMAARYGGYGVAELLLARGADARARNDAGATAADFARMGGREKLALELQAPAR